MPPLLVKAMPPLPPLPSRTPAAPPAPPAADGAGPTVAAEEAAAVGEGHAAGATIANKETSGAAGAAIAAGAADPTVAAGPTVAAEEAAVIGEGDAAGAAIAIDDTGDAAGAAAATTAAIGVAAVAAIAPAQRCRIDCRRGDDCAMRTAATTAGSACSTAGIAGVGSIGAGRAGDRRAFSAADLGTHGGRRAAKTAERAGAAAAAAPGEAVRAVAAVAADGCRRHTAGSAGAAGTGAAGATIGPGRASQRGKQERARQHGAGKQRPALHQAACSRRRERNHDAGNRSFRRAPRERRAARCRRTHAIRMHGLNPPRDHRMVRRRAIPFSRWLQPRQKLYVWQSARSICVRACPHGLPPSADSAPHPEAMQSQDGERIQMRRLASASVG